MKKLSSVFKTYCIFILLSVPGFFLSSCEIDNPSESTVKKEDQYLFIEMSVYLTGKQIPINGHLYGKCIDFQQYRYDSSLNVIDAYSKDHINETDMYILGLCHTLGPGFGSGEVGFLKTTNTMPHFDTILNSYARKKTIIISSVSPEGNISISFMDKIISIPPGKSYQITERTENAEIRNPYGDVQKYEFIEDIYTIKNRGYINKSSVR